MSDVSKHGESSFVRRESNRHATSPAHGINAWIVIGYLLIPFGGLFSIVIGSIILTARKSNHSGGYVSSFSERERKHGKIILYSGSIMLVASILFFMNWFFLEKILFGKPIRLGRGLGT